MDHNVEQSGFDVQIHASKLDANTTLITSQEGVDRASEKMLYAALQQYDFNKQMYGVGYSQSNAGGTLTVERIAELADGVTASLSNVQEINRYVRKYIALDPVIGEAFDIIRNNVNSDYHLSYSKVEGRNKTKQLDAARNAIEQLNRSIKLKDLISKSIPGTALDGTYIMYLRTDGGNAVVDIYPLGVAEVTDYTVNGNPVVQINLKEFQARLRKIYTKDKKGKATFFESLDKEVQANFPPDVYAAYKNGENYVRLDWKRTGVLRINNMGGKYGFSHFFRALRPAVMLEDIETADSINNKAKAKKIIHQKMRKEVMGPSADYTRKGFDLMAFAHQQLCAAWNNQTVLVTTPPGVESISYVEPAVEGTPVEKMALYRNEKMTALGITFLDPELNSVSSATISVKQMMKTVDYIARQLNDVMHRFYAVWLEEQGMDISYAPTIRILDSEEMEMGVKLDLARFLFSTLNLSWDTVLHKLGLDQNDEYAKRQRENDEGYGDVFTPRASQYTTGNSGGSGGENTGGRPAGKSDDAKGKQEYDKGYNENNR